MFKLRTCAICQKYSYLPPYRIRALHFCANCGLTVRTKKANSQTQFVIWNWLVSLCIKIRLAIVVNDHTLSAAIAFPARSFTPVVIVTVYNVEGTNDEECEKVTVLRSALNAKVPGKLVPGTILHCEYCRTRPALHRFAECGCNRRGNCNTCSTGTLELVLVTVGGVVSVGAPVVNDHTLSAAIAFPARSFTPVVIVTV